MADKNRLQREVGRDRLIDRDVALGIGCLAVLSHGHLDITHDVFGVGLAVIQDHVLQRR